MEKLDVARESFERSLELQPDRYIRVYLSRILARNNDYETAFEHLTKGIEMMQPDDTQLGTCYALRAIFHLNTGSFEKFKSDLKKAYDLSPDLKAPDLDTLEPCHSCSGFDEFL